MDWIYLSPHFDDAALSCGGLIWMQRQAGENVAIWTMCAGPIPPGPLSPFATQLHRRWEASLEVSAGSEGDIGSRMVELRRAEDLASCHLLTASQRHFDLPDCIYRFTEETPGVRAHLYESRAALFGPVHPSETRLIGRLSNELDRSIWEGTQLVCPLGLGNHVDHQLTRMAAESLGRMLWYYADFPYTRAEGRQLTRLAEEGWTTITHSISPDGLAAWQESIAVHRTQISTFWADAAEMYLEVQRYAQANGGVRLWKRGR